MSLKLYLIALDLPPGKSLASDYPDVCSHLRELRAEQVLQNQWALRSGFTAEQLRDRFKPGAIRQVLRFGSDPGWQ